MDYGAPPPCPSGIASGFASSTDTADHEVIAAPGDRLALMITALVIHNGHATTGTGVILKSGSVQIWGPIPAPAGNGGAVIVPLNPPLPCAANQPLNFACVDAVSTVSLSALGYRAMSGQS